MKTKNKLFSTNVLTTQNKTKTAYRLLIIVIMLCCHSTYAQRTWKWSGDNFEVNSDKFGVNSDDGISLNTNYIFTTARGINLTRSGLIRFSVTANNPAMTYAFGVRTEFNGSALFSGTAEFDDPVEFDGRADFNAPVTFDSNVKFNGSVTGLTTLPKDASGNINFREKGFVFLIVRDLLKIELPIH